MSALDGFSISSRYQLRNLPKYKNEITAEDTNTKQSVEQLEKTNRYNNIVLGIIALIAISGGTTLLIYSQGINHLQSFIPGSVLSVVGLGVIVGMAVSSYRNGNQQERIEKERLDRNTRIHAKEMLDEMGHAEATDEHRRATMRELTTEERRQFMKGVYSDYFGEGKPDLTAQKKDVVNAFTAVPQEMIEVINAADTSRQFAVDMLKSIDSVLVPVEVRNALFAKIGNPTNEVEGRLLGASPESVRATRNALPDDATKRAYGMAILRYADSDQNSDLMTELMDRPTNADEANVMIRHSGAAAVRATNEDSGRVFAIDVLDFGIFGDDRRQLEIRLVTLVDRVSSVDGARVLAKHPQAIAEVVGMSLDYGFNLLAYVDLTGDALQAIKPPTDEAEEALFARNPVAVARLAYLDPVRFNQQVVGKIFDKMDLAQKTEFLKSMADRLSSLKGQAIDTRDDQSKVRQILQPLLKSFVTGDLLNQLAAEPRSVEHEQLIAQLRRLPESMAELLYQGYPKSLSEGVQTFFKPLLTGMTPDNKSAYYSQRDIHFVEFMRIWKKGQLVGEIQPKLTKNLKTMQSEPNRIRHSLELAYFKAHPGDFKRMVLENEQLGTDAERGQLALNILERLSDVEAKDIISIMDDGSKGYPYFNYLTNMLLAESNKSGEISDSRALLMARFAYAIDPVDNPRRQIENTRTVFGGNAWELQPRINGRWNNFDAAAARFEARFKK